MGYTPPPADERCDPRQAAEERRRRLAASLLQKSYRSYRIEREDCGRNIGLSARWSEAFQIKQREISANEADAGHNDPAARWKRGTFYASQLIGACDKDADEAFRPLHKEMEGRYWLEMVDRKHRKASNLNKYHQYWNTEYDGKENFFYWLDEGEGKDVDLKDLCPRERLEAEQVIYLNSDQRKNYLVNIDEAGKLVWARNGQYVDTQPGKHQDLGEGRGIGDVDPSELAADGSEDDDDEIDTDDNRSSSTLDLGVGHQRMHELKPPGPLKKLKNALTPSKGGAASAPKRTWIFVIDSKKNLYVGIKEAGRFQHSSFLFGARVLAAGLIKARDGVLTDLSPLSGHYKAGTVHFKNFVEHLRQVGCDMSRVYVSKGLVTIGAVEHYGKFNRARRAAAAAVRRVILGQRDESEAASGTAQAAQRNTETDDRDDGEIAAAAGRRERMASVREALPHEGKRKEDMNDTERVERAAALVARAMSRGLAK